MPSGSELWQSAEEYADRCGAKSAKAMRFYALGKMLAEAETAALMDRDIDATEHLRELQAYCEKLVQLLAPAQGLKLVVAA